MVPDCATREPRGAGSAQLLTIWSIFLGAFRRDAVSEGLEFKGFGVWPSLMNSPPPIFSCANVHTVAPVDKTREWVIGE
jgi:hypothetical protein